MRSKLNRIELHSDIKNNDSAYALSKNGRNSCVAKAFATIFDRDWVMINKLFELMGKRIGSGVNNSMWLPLIKPYIESTIDYDYENKAQPTLSSIIPFLNDGIYLINLRKHLTVVKDGKLYDNHDCSRQFVKTIYKVNVNNKGSFTDG